jgi:hypothetical protein
MVVHVVQRGQEFRTITLDKKDWEEGRRGGTRAILAK